MSSQDEVAKNSDSISKYMNENHKGSLEALVRDYGKLVSIPKAVYMRSIDSQGIEIYYESKIPKTIRIPFAPPVETYSEIRQRLAGMAKDSEARVKARKPLIAYKLPVLEVTVALSLVLSVAALRSDSLAQSKTFQDLLAAAVALDKWNQLREFAIGNKSFQRVVSIIVKVHVAEALGMLAFSQSKGASLVTSLKWSLTTFLTGFPSFFKFNHINSPVAQDARLEKKSN
ncbi:hypothetical protein IE53DRAFT_235077 [Violaceomyces palustris]|uniref:Uncharacterized protein n=1 Tax=Violaceomyces palustris TaxID=1673888 RepID=A0ACD0P4M2_9BASI|nr:hypothetical protein IE53DRAFT_235077 [Violaceomyces palustris]